eukprot:9816852-Lingulodinium_polyedra.AAC.1
MAPCSRRPQPRGMRGRWGREPAGEPRPWRERKRKRVRASHRTTPSQDRLCRRLPALEAQLRN